MRLPRHPFTISLQIIAALFCFTFLLSAYAQKQEFRVTEVTLKPDEAKPNGPCPVTVHFAGYITTNGPGTVKYTFTRSDGATAPVFTLEFKAAGTQSVTTDWTLATELPVYDGWQALKVLSPNQMESSNESGAFALTCGKRADTSQNNAQGDALSVLAGDKDFTHLVKGLKGTRVEELLRGRATYTLFAPTDSAFSKLTKERRNVLMSDPSEFTAFVLRHLVAGKVTAADLSTGKIRGLTSVAGSALNVVADPNTKPPRVVMDKSSAIIRPDLSAANVIVHGIDAPLASSSGPIEVIKGDFDKNYPGRDERAAAITARYRDPAGRIRPDLVERAVDAVRRLPISDVRAASATTPNARPDAQQIFMRAAYAPQAEGSWRMIGPAPLIEPVAGRHDSGEATSIVIDPRGTRDKVMYLGTHAGGVWKTNDGGSSWLPLTDMMPSLSIGALALDPADPNIVYAGTASPADGVGIYVSRSAGLYKSTNGGMNWSVKGRSVFGPRPGMPDTSLNTVMLIYQIALPSANVLLVATNRGLFRSVDGGDNFGANSPRFDDGQPLLLGTFVGVAVDTTDSRVVYATQRGTGIFRSTDGGVSFPENLFANPDGTPKPNAPVLGQFGDLSFSQSTLPNNRTLFASVDSGMSPVSYLNLFKSTDGGSTWSTPSTTIRTLAADGYQGNYNLVVAVDPRNADRVFVGFMNIHESTDGGVNFGPAASWAFIHPDYHTIVFSPLSHTDNAQTNPPQTDVYAGNDGGIFGGSTLNVFRVFRWRSLNKGIGTNLVLHIGAGDNPEGQPVYAGLWDHGATSSKTSLLSTDPLAWIEYKFGDGGEVAVVPRDPLTSFQIGNFGIVKTTNAGHSVDEFICDPAVPARVPCLAIPSHPNHIAVSPSRRYPGDRGDSAVIPGHLYTGVGPRLYQDDLLLNTFPNNVEEIETSSPPRLWITLWDVYTGPQSGTVWYKDDTRPFTNLGVLGDAGVNDGNSARIAVAPDDPNTVCVVYSGFTTRSPSSQHVFLSTDNGTSWTDISGDLPDVPVYDVVFDPYTRPRSIIISTAAGVLRTLNPGPGSTWQILGRGLPTIDAVSLAIHTDTRQARLRVGTWGRSVWELVYSH
jgi:uncharacterized surface protein with fasciclin (FAS1) repeats/photosystem II stability/assembly factor-like uncharacterized protein